MELKHIKIGADLPHFLYEAVPPVTQAILTCLLVMYLVCLMFDFEELFARTPADETIVLDEVEIDQIGTQVKTKLGMQNTLNLTLRQKQIEA